MKSKIFEKFSVVCTARGNKFPPFRLGKIYPVEFHGEYFSNGIKKYWIEDHIENDHKYWITEQELEQFFRRFS